MKKLILSLLLCVMFAQAQPKPTGVRVQFFRTLGGSTTFYYWVVAIYPIGTSPLSLPDNTGAVTPATLTAADFVNVTWDPMPGALRYDVLRNTTGTTPTGACNCKVSTTTATNFVDNGAAAGSYTVSTTPGLESSGGLTLASTGTVTNVPVWSKYSVVAIANTVNGCANANGCWQVNGVLGANKTAGLTQSITLFQLPAKGYVLGYRLKTATACANVTTAKLGLGTASSSDLYLTSATGYDIKAAVSATNIKDTIPTTFGSDTSAAVNLVASLTTTVDNIDLITAGCAVDVWVLTNTLP